MWRLIAGDSVSLIWRLQSELIADRECKVQVVRGFQMIFPNRGRIIEKANFS